MRVLRCPLSSFEGSSLKPMKTLAFFRNRARVVRGLIDRTTRTYRPGRIKEVIILRAVFLKKLFSCMTMYLKRVP
jgi:hypothetical protein